MTGGPHWNQSGIWWTNVNKANSLNTTHPHPAAARLCQLDQSVILHAVLPMYSYWQNTKSIKHEFHVLLLQCHAVFICASQKRTWDCLATSQEDTDKSDKFKVQSSTQGCYWILAILGNENGSSHFAPPPTGIWSGQRATLKIVILIRNSRKDRAVNSHYRFLRILFVRLCGDYPFAASFLGLLYQKQQVDLVVACASQALVLAPQANDGPPPPEKVPFSAVQCGAFGDILAGWWGRFQSHVGDLRSPGLLNVIDPAAKWDNPPSSMSVTKCGWFVAGLQ